MTFPPRVERDLGGRILAATVGDLTAFAADAIVNAANSGLSGGGGVDGAIHHAAGPTVMAELRRDHAGGTPTGTAVLTAAGALDARWIVHAVGPVWRGGSGGEPELLSSAYRTAFALADEAGARSIACPAISCGIYDYPVELAADVAIAAVAEALRAARTIEVATFVLYSRPTYEVFAAALERAPIS